MLCQWESEQTISVIDKSVYVNVTHVPTNVTITYPSYRKAALSFATEYPTTGQTLKVFADNGKLFKCEYKIVILTKDN